jgi:hypothetical protein
LFEGSLKMLIISAMVLKMAKRTQYKKSVRQFYSGDESLSNLENLEIIREWPIRHFGALILLKSIVKHFVEVQLLYYR